MGTATRIVVGGLGGLLVIGGCVAMTEESEPTAPSEVTASAPQEPATAGEQKPAKKAKEAKQAEPAPEPEPKFTTQQENAIRAAQNYVDLMSFSKQGLIQQLSSPAGDGYPKADAEIAVEHIDVDWYAEAVEAAESYMDLMPMSRSGLIQQLTSSAGDGFTRKQAVHAADTLGL